MIQVISELLMNHRTSYLQTANCCGILADEFRTLILYLDLEDQEDVHVRFVLLRLYWHAMNTYFTNANTTEISWAKRTKNVTKEKLCKQHSICQRLISLIYGSHENSNKNGNAGEAKIGAFMSHLRWPVLFLWINEIYFV
ncbi:hypothetical protein Tsp_04537 [Trichinella spiralis]|uniref:hypothetical protein n=1 Tax=Trichinella spiralis TaxID=6334 RepID=UPI0001EFEEE7|nr:hypothetical protein Tsp_04537 [Trichinella spiralis]